MDKKEILDLVGKDFATLANIERSMSFMLNSWKGKGHQYKILYSAFRRTKSIMLKRKHRIAKILGLKLKPKPGIELWIPTIKSPLDN